MKKLCIILWACCSLPLCAEVFTLQQCIDTALVNNNQIRRQTNAYEQQRLAYKQAKENISPSINGSVGQSWVFGRSIGADNVYTSQNSSQTTFNLNANLVLFDGLQMKFLIDQTKASMRASEAEVEALQQQIKMNISAMYLQVLLNKELLKVAEMQLEDTQSKLRKTEALIAADRLPQGESYALQAQAAKEEMQLTQAQSDLQLSLLDLAQAMDLMDFRNFDILVPADEELVASLLPSNDEVYRIAVQNRAEIKALEHLVVANESALKGAKAAYSPTLAVGANLGTGYYNMSGTGNDKFGKQLGDNLSTSVGLSLNIPIFDRMQTPNNVRRAKLTIEDSRLQLEQRKKDLRKEIDQAYYNALAAQKQEYSAQKAEQSGAEAFRYAGQKLEAGRADAYQYQEAKNNYMQAQSERLQAKYNYLFKLKILEYYQGVL